MRYLISCLGCILILACSSVNSDGAFGPDGGDGCEFHVQGPSWTGANDVVFDEDGFLATGLAVGQENGVQIALEYNQLDTGKYRVNIHVFVSEADWEEYDNSTRTVCYPATEETSVWITYFNPDGWEVLIGQDPDMTICISSMRLNRVFGTGEQAVWTIEYLGGDFSGKVYYEDPEHGLIPHDAQGEFHYTQF